MQTRPLRTDNTPTNSKLRIPEKEKRIQCTKIVFVLLDFLDRWIREWEWKKAAQSRENEHYKIIQAFATRFCKLQLAKCNYECGEYPRALMYIEDYIAKNPNLLHNHLYILAEVLLLEVFKLYF